MAAGDVLHLHLKFEYFDAIKRGEKLEEFRDATKWEAKLKSGNYQRIRLYRGYQKISPESVLNLPYKGYILKTITHPHFGNAPRLVCAINVAH